MAQLGARFHGMEEVVGSIPTRSTKSLIDESRHQRLVLFVAVSFSLLGERQLN